MSSYRITPFRMTSRLSEFNTALSEDLAAAMREQRQVALPSDNVYGYRHGTRWHSRSSEETQDDQADEMQVHSMKVEILLKEVVDNDVSSLTRYVNDVVSGMMQEFMRGMYQTISDATDKTGNLVDGRGGDFKAEQFIEMLEKIEFGVDRNGNVSLPEIHAGPELADKIFRELSAQGQDFEERIQKITKQKSDAALAKEEERKSKFPKRADK